MDREELKDLLETPLDPNLDYFDATASITAMAEQLRNQHRLIVYLFEALAIQGQSLISVRQMQAAQRGAIEVMADELGLEGNEDGPIEAVRAPALVGPNGRKLS